MIMGNVVPQTLGRGNPQPVCTFHRGGRTSHLASLLFPAMKSHPSPSDWVCAHPLFHLLGGFSTCSLLGKADGGGGEVGVRQLLLQGRDSKRFVKWTLNSL